MKSTGTDCCNGGRSRHPGAHWPLVLTAALWISAGSLACNLAARAGAPGADTHGYSVAAQLLGQCSVAVAEHSFYNKADGFYHRGRPHQTDKAFTNDFFQALHREIAPVGHAHLHGDDVKDVLAWIRIAISLNPHNVDYALVAAYWLQRELGREDAALEALQEAALANPDSYLPYLGRGRLYGRIGDMDRTRRAYEQALSRWPGNRNRNDADTRIDKREILQRLALISELEGNVPAAMAYLRQIIAAFPDESVIIREQLTRLENNQAPPLSALDRWNALRKAEYHHFCEAETDEHGHSPHHDRAPDGQP